VRGTVSARQGQTLTPAATRGAQIGFLEVPAQLRTYAADAAREFHARQVASDYTEQVDTAIVPRPFLKLQCKWVPRGGVLEQLGFRAPAPGTKAHLVLTTGVDPHVDDYLGDTLLWTLHNDGLEFWQRGGARRTPPAGDILIFDDRIPHSVDLTRAQQKDSRFESAVWIGWALPVARAQKKGPP
jgi:hypothetical protein